MKLWFADYNKKYDLEQLTFYPISEISSILPLAESVHRINQEVAFLWKDQSSGLADVYGDFDGFDDKQYPPKSWKKIVLQAWGIQNSKLMQKFPVLASIIKKDKRILSCHIASLAPHSIIKAHSGETNAIWRVHLGLKVPKDYLNCAIQVAKDQKAWEENEFLAFLDAQEHKVWNNTNEYRFILIFDVLREEFKHLKWYIIVRIIISQVYFMIMAKLALHNLSERTPKLFFDVLAVVLFLPVCALIFLQNNILKWRL